MKPGAEIVLPANVAPLIAKSAILQGQPYLKVILKGSHEEWLAAMKVNNYVLERDEFSDTSWTQKLDNSNESKMGTWTELTSRMRMDGSMCTEKKIGEVTYPVVQNKKVIAFVYYRNNAIPGYGCWVMKEPTIGFPIRLR